jgi:exodeoxyribonuclease III
MRIATYNVNSIRAREERFVEWIEGTKPDIVCLQELKVEDDKFPALLLRGLGYEAAVYGQKTYNGVAVLSKTAITDEQRGMGDGDEDPQARVISAVTNGLRVVSVYVPNGESLSSDKYAYKLRFLERLGRYVDGLLAAGMPFIVAGDYNIAPEDLDCYDPVAWRDSVLCSDKERAAFAALLQKGLIDSVRVTNPDKQIFSWWDYRMLSFPKNKGLRIDHLLLSPDLGPRLKASGLDREARKGKQPSDHGPMWIELS